jgi:hypothetical protein
MGWTGRKEIGGEEPEQAKGRHAGTRRFISVAPEGYLARDCRICRAPSASDLSSDLASSRIRAHCARASPTSGLVGSLALPVDRD